MRLILMRSKTIQELTCFILRRQARVSARIFFSFLVTNWLYAWLTWDVLDSSLAESIFLSARIFSAWGSYSWDPKPSKNWRASFCAGKQESLLESSSRSWLQIDCMLGWHGTFWIPLWRRVYFSPLASLAHEAHTHEIQNHPRTDVLHFAPASKSLC